MEDEGEKNRVNERRYRRREQGHGTNFTARRGEPAIMERSKRDARHSLSSFMSRSSGPCMICVLRKQVRDPLVTLVQTGRCAPLYR